jgi:transposase
MLGDSAYLARVNCDLSSELGFEPFFHPRSNTTLRAGRSSAWRNMVRLWRENLEEFKDHYRHRGNVESAFSTVKRLFGCCVYSRNPAAQDSEILLKVLCHNLVALIGAAFEMNLDLEESFVVEWTPAEVTA